MDPQIKVDTNLAHDQWSRLIDLIDSTNNEIIEIKPIENLPDMVFTANAGLIRNNKAVVSNFLHAERSGEEPYFKSFFQENGYETIEVEKNFEGAGDALFCGDLLFAGYGFRTDKAVFKEFKAHLDIKVISCRLLDPYFYHLDTCFCPLDEKRALYWPLAFDKWIDEDAYHFGIRLLGVPSDESRNFACNAVVLENTVILPSECPNTKRMLVREGFQVFDCPMSEFIKAGGACKCLTLVLNEPF